VSSSILEIQTPRVFVPLLEPARYKGAWGGRGSGKSHFFAEALVERAVLEPGLRFACVREIQKSLQQSVKRLIEDKIEALGVGHVFDVQRDVIKTPGGGTLSFHGLQNHTADSIKSLEGYDGAWIEEAQSISAHSLRLLRPTIRKPGSEIWASWNPESADDPIDQLLRGPDRITDAVVVEANWRDNPWFPDVLNDERLRDQNRDQDEYEHVWNGHYLTISDAIIFRNRVSVEEFDSPTNARFFHGADWGFSQDPTVLIRCFVADDVLYIDQEAFGYGVELDDTPALFDSIPTARKWPIKADNARPETISHMRRRGFPQIGPAEKWKGSVEDGVACLKGFKRIVVHPRCPHTAKEFRLYSFKVDKITGDILPIIVDKWNHGIDALRYALDGYIKGRGPMRISAEELRKI
jgi:phage terminase large subunit